MTLKFIAIYYYTFKFNLINVCIVNLYLFLRTKGVVITNYYIQIIFLLHFRSNNIILYVFILTSLPPGAAELDFKMSWALLNITTYPKLLQRPKIQNDTKVKMFDFTSPSAILRCIYCVPTDMKSINRPAWKSIRVRLKLM